MLFFFVRLKKYVKNIKYCFLKILLFLVFPQSKRPQQRRTLPPLPIEAHNFAAFASAAAAAAMAAAQSPTVFPIPASSRNASNHPPPNQPQPKEDHQICYGIEASMLRSTSGIYGIEDSYYEDGINGNFTTTRKSNSVFNNQEDSSGVSSCCTGTDSINPTHRVQSTFIPRHDDEILLEIGDAIHVERECEDHWCYGTNLRSGQHGIFPAAHICEIDLVEEICNNALINATTRVLPISNERDTFYLTMLASIEVAHHKGNDVLVQSINKVCSMYQDKEEIIVPQTVLMEVSFRGIHIIDKRRKDVSFLKFCKFNFLIFSYFSSLNVQHLIFFIVYKIYHFVVHIQNSFDILALSQSIHCCHVLHVMFFFQMNPPNQLWNQLVELLSVHMMNIWLLRIQPKIFILNKNLI
jgi:hypothetical protein